MPLINNFKAENIRNAIILNSLYFTVITVTTITVSNFFTKLFEDKERNMKISEIRHNLDNNIKVLHQKIQAEHNKIKKSPKVLKSVVRNKIEKNENEIITLINDKNKNLNEIIGEINTLRELTDNYKKILYKTSDDNTRTKLINKILIYDKRIKKLKLYIDYQSKVSIKFKTEIIIIITIITSFSLGFLIYLLFYLIVGFGGGMLTPCSDNISCNWK